MFPIKLELKKALGEAAKVTVDGYVAEEVFTGDDESTVCLPNEEQVNFPAQEVEIDEAGECTAIDEGGKVRQLELRSSVPYLPSEMLRRPRVVVELGGEGEVPQVLSNVPVQIMVAKPLNIPEPAIPDGYQVFLSEWEATGGIPGKSFVVLRPDGERLPDDCATRREGIFAAIADQAGLPQPSLLQPPVFEVAQVNGNVSWGPGVAWMFEGGFDEAASRRVDDMFAAEFNTRWTARVSVFATHEDGRRMPLGWTYVRDREMTDVQISAFGMEQLWQEELQEQGFKPSIVIERNPRFAQVLVAGA